MKILFICKYNRFRSRIAAEYFKKINKNKNIKIDSAGLIKGNSVDKGEVKVLKEFGININGKPKALSSKLLETQDLIIIVANDVPKQVLKCHSKKIINWKIKDATRASRKQIIPIVKKIIKKTERLNKRLEKK